MNSLNENRTARAKGSLGSLRTIGLSLQSKTGARAINKPVKNFSSVINTFQIGNVSVQESGASNLRGERNHQLTEKLIDLGETIEDHNSYLEEKEKVHQREDSSVYRFSHHGTDYLPSRNMQHNSPPSPDTERKVNYFTKSPKLAKKIQLRLNTVPVLACKKPDSPAVAKVSLRSVSLQFPLKKMKCSLTPKVSWSYLQQIQGDVDHMNESRMTSCSSISINNFGFQGIEAKPRARVSMMMKIKLNQKTLAIEQSSHSHSGVSLKERSDLRTSQRQVNPISLTQGSENKLSSNPFFKTDSRVNRFNVEHKISPRKLSAVSSVNRGRLQSNHLQPEESYSSYEKKDIMPNAGLLFLEQDQGIKSFTDEPSIECCSQRKAPSQASPRAIDTVVDLAKLLEKSNPFQEFLATKQSLRLQQR